MVWRLKYVKAPFGPYAETLRHVLKSIEGYFVSGYADGGDTPNKEIELVPGAIKDASSLIAHDAEIRQRFDRVANLVEGFETPFGLELLATVHWVATREYASTRAEVLNLTYAWNERKKRFSERQIDLAYERLKSRGWLQ